MTRVDIPSGGGTGEAEFTFWLPGHADWPGTDSHYVAVALRAFDASGAKKDEVVAFAGACA